MLKQMKKTHASHGMRFYYVFVALVSLVLGIYAVSVVNDVYAFVKEDVTATITVEMQETAQSLGQKLWAMDVIAHPEIFSCYAKGFMSIPGNYTVSALLDYEDLIDALTPKAEE